MSGTGELAQRSRAGGRVMGCDDVRERVGWPLSGRDNSPLIHLGEVDSDSHTQLLLTQKPRKRGE